MGIPFYIHDAVMSKTTENVHGAYVAHTRKEQERGGERETEHQTQKQRSLSGPEAGSTEAEKMSQRDIWQSLLSRGLY